MQTFREISSFRSRAQSDTTITSKSSLRKQVKDPNLVSALTGHVEGSRAFTRYRTIDIDMKKDLVKILEGGK